MGTLESIWVPLFAAFIGGMMAFAGGLVGVWWTNRSNQKRRQMEMKLDVLRRFTGYAYRLRIGWNSEDAEPFAALNQVWAVFADSPNVKRAIETLYKDYSKRQMGPGAQAAKGTVNLDSISAVARSMAVECNVPLEGINEDLMSSIFTPKPPSKRYPRPARAKQRKEVSNASR